MYVSKLHALFVNTYSKERGLELCIDFALSLFAVVIFAPVLKYSSRIVGLDGLIGLLIGFCFVFIGITYFGRLRV